MLSREDNLCVGGKSKTLKQRRCAACRGMHIDGEGNSPKNGSNLAGKCPPPPQAAGQPTLRDGSTSNGTSAQRGQVAPEIPAPCLSRSIMPRLREASLAFQPQQELRQADVSGQHSRSIPCGLRRQAPQQGKSHQTAIQPTGDPLGPCPFEHMQVESGFPLFEQPFDLPPYPLYGFDHRRRPDRRAAMRALPAKL